MAADASTSDSFRVLVVSGGYSPEREVSLQSGLNVADSLRQAGHIPDRWDPADRSADEINSAEWDIAFPMLHGTGGEDGVLHRTLQQIGLPWVGSSISSSFLTFDKSLTRERLQAHGIPIPPGRTIGSIEAPMPQSWPVVVKPARQGSSIGVTIVEGEVGWSSAVATALSLSSEAVIESYIAGREISIPVIDGEVFPAVEIEVPNGWYDYHNKYENESTKYHIAPADLPDDLNTIARRSCDVCDAEGILRVDLRINDRGEAYVLEINSIPGMTTHSLVPMSVESTGLSLPEFCDQCVRRALS